MDLMIDFAKAFERRYRDVRKQCHCLSIEHRYDNGQRTDGDAATEARFGEDALWLGLQAWGQVPRALQAAIKVSFGIGAKSQTEYELRLNQAVQRQGRKVLHSQTDLGLATWLQVIKNMTEEDFGLLYERI